MDTKKLPYEILVRFDEDGAVKGAHVIWAYKVTDGDRAVSYQPGPAERAGNSFTGFPLSDAVSEALAGGLEKAAAMLHENASLKQDHRTLQAVHAAVLDENERLKRQLQAVRRPASNTTH